MGPTQETATFLLEFIVLSFFGFCRSHSTGCSYDANKKLFEAFIYLSYYGIAVALASELYIPKLISVHKLRIPDSVVKVVGRGILNKWVLDSNPDARLISKGCHESWK